ncbi:MAG: hypothetical protein ACR2I2_13445 [Bryobacteraceae bacterium]
MIDRLARPTGGFAWQVLMGLQPAVRTYVGVLPKYEFLNARNAKLGHQGEKPSEGFAKSIQKTEPFAFLIPGVHGKHSAYFYEVRERCCRRPVSVLLTVRVGDHLIKIVEPQWRVAHDVSLNDRSLDVLDHTPE